MEFSNGRLTSFVSDIVGHVLEPSLLIFNWEEEIIIRATNPSLLTLPPISHCMYTTINANRSAFASPHSFACSSFDNRRRGGPLRLPSSHVMGFFDCWGILSFHRFLIDGWALFSKQSAIYRPNIGRNLKPLRGMGMLVIN